MDIYILENSETQLIPETFCHRLFPERMKKAERYLKADDRLMCIGAGLLISLIARVNESEIYISECGKPYAKNGIFFNVSHSGNCAALAFGGHETGIDIEKINGDNLYLAEHIFTKQELQWVNTDPVTRFHILWSIKESVLKAAGTGLYSSVTLPEVYPETNHVCVNGMTYYFNYGIFENKSIAVSSTVDTGKLHIKKISADEIMNGCFERKNEDNDLQMSKKYQTAQTK